MLLNLSGEPRVNGLGAPRARVRRILRTQRCWAHLAMRHVLTPMQIAEYDHLRGYGKEHAMMHGVQM